MNSRRSTRGGPVTPSGRARACGAAAAVMATAVLAVACSSATPGPQVASLGGHHGSGAAGGQLTTAQSDRDMVNFARCMRAHGVAMPDPVHEPGHTGLTLQFPSATPGPGMRAAN